MKPDDELLALWVEDELTGPEKEAVEAWASANEEWSELREQARASRKLLGSVLSADEPVPHAEFFNARIRREIEAPVRSASVRETAMPRIWTWLMPLSAAAALVLGFWIGRGGPPAVEPGAPAPLADLTPVIYTPAKGVRAEVVPSDEGIVIVLAGLEDLPDDWEVPDSAAVEPVSETRTVSAEER